MQLELNPDEVRVLVRELERNVDQLEDECERLENLEEETERLHELELLRHIEERLEGLLFPVP